MYDCYDRTVILDYAHNIEGYRAVISSLKKIKGKKSLIGVVGIPGDRKNDIGYAIGEICAKNFDKIVIKEDKDKRGRRSGEIAELLQTSILKNNKNVDMVICLDEVDALKRAIEMSEKDDIIIVFYEKLNPLLDFINEEETMNINSIDKNYKQYSKI
jgi:cyanophycin synthetase